MRILFAIGVAVSTLLLTSCSNPDASGGVTMQKGSTTVHAGTDKLTSLTENIPPAVVFYATALFQDIKARCLSWR